MLDSILDYIAWRLGIMCIIDASYPAHSHWWWFPAVVAYAVATEVLFIMLRVYRRISPH